MRERWKLSEAVAELPDSVFAGAGGETRPICARPTRSRRPTRWRRPDMPTYPFLSAVSENANSTRLIRVDIQRDSYLGSRCTFG